MNPTQKKQITLYASIVIGAGSGPFLFRAAGISDFPKLDISHFVIAVCYGVGAIKISMLILLRLLSSCPNGPAEKKNTAEQDAPSNGGKRPV